jgi:ribonuclease PH
MRPDGRARQEIRPLTIELSPVRYPAGSALIKLGDTHVLCTVTVQDDVPGWRKKSGKGWLTAEYALLPGSTHTRTPRTHTRGGRAQEIRRLIGRSLRRAVDLELLGTRTLTVDCDVLQADGGTRTASVNGGYIAVALAVQRLVDDGLVLPETLKPPIAAISVGQVDGESRVDLAYAEDSIADVDLNVVMDDRGRFIEVQGTAEGDPIDRAVLDELLDCAATGIQAVLAVQREAQACAGIES